MGSYKKFFSYLEPFCQIGGIEKLGHNSDYPVVNNWTYSVQELIDHIKANYTEPVIGIGHSLGGVLNFLAAHQAPQLFKAVIALDPPLYGSFKSKMIYLAKRFNFIHRLTPSNSAKTRRRQWDTIEEALYYFKRRVLFKYFDIDCLKDYLNAGLIKKENHFILNFDPEVEYKFFTYLPDHSPRFSQPLSMPWMIIYGENTHLFNRYDLRVLRRRYHAELKSISGSHLFPFEYPFETAEKIKQFLIEHRLI